MIPPSAAAESGECCSPAAACCVVPMSSGAKYHAWGSRKHLGFLNSHPSEYPRPSSCIYSLSTGCILPSFPSLSMISCLVTGGSCLSCPSCLRSHGPQLLGGSSVVTALTRICPDPHQLSGLCPAVTASSV